MTEAYWATFCVFAVLGALSLIVGGVSLDEARRDGMVRAAKIMLIFGVAFSVTAVVFAMLAIWANVA